MNLLSASLSKACVEYVIDKLSVSGQMALCICSLQEYKLKALDEVGFQV